MAMLFHINTRVIRRRKMRKLCIAVVVMVLCAGAVSVFASGIDNKTNWSAGYARTMNRNAVYDAPDAAVYNPAGIGMMESGLYASVNNQSLFLNYSHESATETYSAKNPTLFLPSAFVVYKRNMLGFYGAFYVPAGGGSLEYDDGIVDLNEGIPSVLPPLALSKPSAELFGVYYAGTAGAVYSFKKMVSVSAGLRYISSTQKQKFSTALPSPSVLLDTKATSSGFGGIFGIDLRPISGLNIGVRYETNTKLEWEYKDVAGPLAAGLGISKGGKFNRDLPAILGIGASYLVLPKLKVEGSLDYYFNKNADWDGDEDDVDNGFAIGAAAEYALLEKLKVSAGFLFTKTGADPDSYIYLNPALDSVTIAGGALYQFTEKLSAELGVIKPFYSADDATSLGATPVDVDKSLWIVALGVRYKIF
jgi:long-chain fatty acid transport protein